MRLFLGCNTIAEFDAVPDAPRCSPVKLQHIMPWSSESGFWEATGQFQADGWQPSLASPRSSLWSDLRGGRVPGRKHLPSRLTNSTRDKSSKTPSLREQFSFDAKSPVRSATATRRRGMLPERTGLISPTETEPCLASDPSLFRCVVTVRRLRG